MYLMGQGEGRAGLGGWGCKSVSHVLYIFVCIIYIVSCHNYMYYVCET